MNFSAQQLGKWGEKLAAAYLLKQGYSILAENFKTPYGELDLIAEQAEAYNPDEKTIVFVEVKTRRSKSFGYPEDSVTPIKQEHIIAAAQYYLQEHPSIESDWRIDVIAIEYYQDHDPVIQHFENAVNE